jgi:hypothetical protein
LAPWRGIKAMFNAYRTREGTLRALRTIAWVIPLTLLIWAWAEREQAVEEQVVLPIQISSGVPDRVVVLTNSTNRNITAKLFGPRAGIDAVRAKAGANPFKIVLGKADLPADSATKQVSVMLRELLGRDEIFKSSGVAIQGTDPPYVMVGVDQLDQRKLPVEASAEDEQRLGQIIIQTDPVTVTGPRLLFMEAEDQRLDYVRYLKKGRLVLLANLRDYFADGKPARHENVDLPIRFPIPDQPVQHPSSVKATIELRPLVKKSATLQVVPIYSQAPNPILNTYKIVCDPEVLRNVKVTGPEKQIDLLLPSSPGAEPAFKPYVVLKIGETTGLTGDVGVARKFAAEDFVLPAGVTVEGEYSVTVKLTPIR